MTVAPVGEAPLVTTYLSKPSPIQYRPKKRFSDVAVAHTMRPVLVIHKKKVNSTPALQTEPPNSGLDLTEACHLPVAF
jgi:hypothetical protein